MPRTAKGEKIMSAMKSQYGEKKGESVFFASANKGTITGVEGAGKAHPHNPGMDMLSEMAKAAEECCHYGCLKRVSDKQ